MTSRPLLDALARDPQKALADIGAEKARRSGSRSFAAFVKQAWQYVPQVQPLVWNWHMQAIADHAEAVARGQIDWLAVNIPPGHAKSVFTSVLWPAWIWSWWPRCQFIFGSYSHSFVIRDARRCRDVIQSDWYRETYSGPAGWQLRGDYGAADNFENTTGGVRFATSIGGAGAGLRAHVVGVDDPLNIADAHSKTKREEATEWLRDTLSQRFIVGHRTRFLLTMQRLHAEDPTRWVMEQPGAQCLRLPAEFEAQEPCSTKRYEERRNGHVERVLVDFWSDPRKEQGELLFPQLVDRDRVEGDKVRLGPFGHAAQNQQRPSPEGGGMFKIADWRYWTADTAMMDRLGYGAGARPRGAWDGSAKPVDLTLLDEQLISVDASFRETKSGSYVAIHVWAKKGARRLLLYRIRKRMDFTDTVHALAGPDGKGGVIALFPEARRKLIEGKANGDAIISSLERAHGVTGCEAVSPGTANKVARAHAQQPLQAAGNVELPEGAPWLEEYIRDHGTFPNGESDDDVDAQSQALSGFETEMTAGAWLAVLAAQEA